MSDGGPDPKPATLFAGATEFEKLHLVGGVYTGQQFALGRTYLVF
jgi:hypothetical protein